MIEVPVEPRQPRGNGLRRKGRDAGRTAKIAQDGVGAPSNVVQGVVDLVNADLIFESAKLAPTRCIAAQFARSMVWQILEDVGVDRSEMGHVESAADRRFRKLRKAVRDKERFPPIISHRRRPTWRRPRRARADRFHLLRSERTGLLPHRRE